MHGHAAFRVKALANVYFQVEIHIYIILLFITAMYIVTTCILYGVTAPVVAIVRG